MSLVFEIFDGKETPPSIRGRGKFNVSSDQQSYSHRETPSIKAQDISNAASTKDVECWDYNVSAILEVEPALDLNGI